mgnify:CR=1 FL=1
MFIQNDLKYKNLTMDQLKEGDPVYLSLFDISLGKMYFYLGLFSNDEGKSYHRIIDADLQGFSYYYDGYVYTLDYDWRHY